MAQCNFSIPFQASPQAIADQARSAIVEAGGTFDGSSDAGIFDVNTPLGAVRGSYLIEAQVIHVSIHSKPLFVSCGLIEKQLKDYFAALV